MKIAINTRLIVKGKMAGEANYIYSLLKQFAQIDETNEYHLVFDRPYDKTIFHFAFDNPRFHFHIIGPQTRIAPLMDYWFQVSIKNFLKKNKIDLFFSPEPYAPIGLHTKCVITIHDLAFVKMPWITYYINSLHAQIMIKLSANSADKIISVSHHTSSDIQKYYGISRDKISVIHHGIKSEDFGTTTEIDEDIKLFVSDGMPYLLFVGTIEPRKNLERLILAFKMVLDQGLNYRLIIAGRNGWKNRMVFETAENLGLGRKIIFTGYISERTLSELYSRAHIFAYVPLYEGFGMPVSEAMSYGLPIVTSNVSSIPEVVGDAAIKIDPWSVEDIYRGLISLLQNREMREQLGRDAKERSKIFSWEKSALTHIKIFKDVYNKI